MEDTLRRAIEVYGQLLDFDYTITTGRKGVLENINLRFSKSNFHHLAGFHYLKDRPTLNRKSDEVFDEINSSQIDLQSIVSSSQFEIISSRILALSLLKDVLDGEFLIYRYDQTRNRFSNIRADYVIKASTTEGELFFFLIKDEKSDNDVYGCSLILNGKLDYSLNQIRTTILAVSKKSS